MRLSMTRRYSPTRTQRNFSARSLTPPRWSWVRAKLHRKGLLIIFTIDFGSFLVLLVLPTFIFICFANTMTDTSTYQFLGEGSLVRNSRGCFSTGSCLPSSSWSNEGESEGVGGYQLKWNRETRPNVDGPSILTEEFNRLTVKEREDALNDLHGVADIIKETPKFVEAAIKGLVDEISRVKQNRAAYDKAVFLNPNYVESDEFRLLFLRAERFDILKAATRMVMHFTIKRELFGIDCLARNITYDDLNEDEREMYMTASHWLLDSYDRSGRRIVFMYGPRVIFKQPHNYLRMMWYIYMVAAMDVQTQTHGGISLLFQVGGDGGAVDVPSLMALSKLDCSIPIHWTAFHYCQEGKSSTGFPDVTKVIQLAMNTMGRIKFRIHRGSLVELKYALVGYGICSDDLPMNSTGELDVETFKKKVQERREIESKIKERAQSSTLIEHPTSLDVLLGRGRPYQDFPGNVRLNQVVELRRQAYESTTKVEKTAIAFEIIHALNSLGGRFLKRVSTSSSSPDDTHDTTGCNNTGSGGGGGGSYWEEVDITAAHRKVSNSFQTRKRRKSTPHDT